MSDGGSCSVSPGLRLYSQSYPSIYSPAAVSALPAAQQGNGGRERERDRAALEEVERARERAGIVDLEEEEEEDGEEEDMDGRRRNLNESTGVCVCVCRRSPSLCLSRALSLLYCIYSFIIFSLSLSLFPSVSPPLSFLFSLPHNLLINDKKGDAQIFRLSFSLFLPHTLFPVSFF